MSFLGIHILTDEQFDALKKAGHEVTTFAISEVDKAVAAAKTTDLGKSVAAAIQAVDNQTLSGTQKFEQALAAILPEVLHYLTGGGVSALIDDVEDFGRQLLQSVFNDVKSSTAGKIAGELLDAIGL